MNELRRARAVAAQQERIKAAQARGLQYSLSGDEVSAMRYWKEALQDLSVDFVRIPYCSAIGKRSPGRAQFYYLISEETVRQLLTLAACDGELDRIHLVE